jgi:hypothetical protein
MRAKDKPKRYGKLSKSYRKIVARLIRAVLSALGDARAAHDPVMTPELHPILSQVGPDIIRPDAKTRSRHLSHCALDHDHDWPDGRVFNISTVPTP